MKKFFFTLRSVLKIKRIFKKQKQAELSEAGAELERLVMQKHSLEDELGKSRREYEMALGNKMSVSQMVWYNDYSDYLKNCISQMEPKITAVQSRKDKLQAELIAISRETDTLERLEKEQYRAYLAEAAKEEEKMLDEVMSYQCTMRQSDTLHEMV